VGTPVRVSAVVSPYFEMRVRVARTVSGLVPGSSFRV